MIFDTIETLVAQIAEGKLVVMLDDASRENEGDFIMAADHVTPEAINFMSRYGRGLICMPISSEKANKLQLPMMVSALDNHSQYHTNFTVSVEAAKGVTTGISVFDRAKTIQTVADSNVSRQDIVMPGHIFPLVAEDEGVLVRPGHTEAACDLSELAGLSRAGVLVEILNEEGAIATKEELFCLAKQFGLKIGCIADLIAYKKEKATVRRMGVLV